MKNILCKTLNIHARILLFAKLAKTRKSNLRGRRRRGAANPSHGDAAGLSCALRDPKGPVDDVEGGGSSAGDRRGVLRLVKLQASVRLCTRGHHKGVSWPVLLYRKRTNGESTRLGILGEYGARVWGGFGQSMGRCTLYACSASTLFDSTTTAEEQLKSSKKSNNTLTPSLARELRGRAYETRTRSTHLNDNNKLTTKDRAPSQDPPRTGAFEVVLRASPPMVSSSKVEDKTLWSKLQVGEPSSSEPETLRAVSNAILMELRSALNREA